MPAATLRHASLMAVLLLCGSIVPGNAADDNAALGEFLQSMANLKTAASICYGFVHADTKVIVNALDDYWAEVGDGTDTTDIDQIVGMRGALRELSPEEARQTCAEHLQPALNDYRAARSSLLKTMGAQSRNPPDLADRDW